MSHSRKSIEPFVTPATPTGGPWTATDPWAAFEHLLRALPSAAGWDDQVRLALGAVRTAAAADVVYWVAADRPPVAVGRPALPPRWFHAVTRRVRDAGEPDGGSVWTPADGCGGPDPTPRSVALVRLGRSAWLGAVRFRPGDPFDPGHLGAVALARRALLHERWHAQLTARVRDTLLGLVRCLAAAVEARDPYTWGHSERVARIAARVGRQMGLPEPDVSDLYLGGLLHDLGKIGVRDDVLRKPGRLTEEELRHVREHPVIGDRLVAHSPQLAHLRPAVRSHHERWDGGGYPDRLAGGQIPPVARVLAVADACDAMLSARPYRDPLAQEQVEATLAAGAGSQWDPAAVRHLFACREEVYAICARGPGDSMLAAIEHALGAGRGTPLTGSQSCWTDGRPGSPTGPA